MNVISVVMNVIKCGHEYDSVWSWIWLSVVMIVIKCGHEYD